MAILGASMEAEIREQPAQLAANRDRYLVELGVLESVKPEVILLVARGSSDHAALYARYLFEIHLEVPVVLAAPSVWTQAGKQPRYPKALAIGISQSGAAPDVAEVLGAMRRSGHATLAISNTAGSRVVEAAEHALLLGVGAERSVAATKTYTASLLALYQAVRAMGAALPDPDLPDDSWVKVAETAALDQLRPVLGGSPLFALGRRFGFATAHETALKLMECALLPCKAYSTADFEHGPRALAGPKSAAVVFGDVPSLLEIQGASVVRPPIAPVPQEMQPLWDAVFAQWLALHAARVRGLDPDLVENLSKVTETL